MKRLHLHINTTAHTFEQSIHFYSTLFNSAPTKKKEHYAKWMLEDPKVNFVLEVLETSGDTAGIHHVGIQVDESAELVGVHEALKAIDAPLLDIGNTSCCYSESEKFWSQDPSGVRWETFHSTADIADYGAKTPEELDLYNSEVQ